ncbi:MAG TPA: hypothetical protein VMU12_03000 [Candidatus Paceibacterota bacterium]|nr:hypothetical protein [Candidatus Paceibacterota bacterium]
MAYSALLEYIRKAKGCNASDDDIVDRLVKSGWYRVDAQDALALYEKLTRPAGQVGSCEPLMPPPAPSVLEHIAPHHYEPRLIAVAAVVFALACIGFVVLRH